MNSSLVDALAGAAQGTVAVLTLAALVFAAIQVVRGSRRRGAQRSNATVVALDLLTQEARPEELLESEDYILRRLRDAHGPDGGVDGLPEEARKHVTRIALFYSSLGMMLTMDSVDQDVLVRAVSYRVLRHWAILEPYIMRERQIRKSRYMAHLEHLAAVAAAAHRRDV
jgi:hypothetical protein